MRGLTRIPIYSEEGFALFGRPVDRAGAEAMFWERVRITTGCWEWMAARNPRTGYGTFRSRWFDDTYAHRISWVIANGPVPDGLGVLHHCDNPPCVRPDHLYAGTAADNASDREKRGRGRYGLRIDATD